MRRDGGKSPPRSPSSRAAGRRDKSCTSARRPPRASGAAHAHARNPCPCHHRRLRSTGRDARRPRRPWRRRHSHRCRPPYPLRCCHRPRARCRRRSDPRRHVRARPHRGGTRRRRPRRPARGPRPRSGRRASRFLRAAAARRARAEEAAVRGFSRVFPAHPHAPRPR